MYSQKYSSRYLPVNSNSLTWGYVSLGKLVCSSVKQNEEQNEGGAACSSDTQMGSGRQWKVVSCHPWVTYGANSWLCPGPALAIAAFWEVKQEMKDFSVSLQLYLPNKGTNLYCWRGRRRNCMGYINDLEIMLTYWREYSKCSETISDDDNDDLKP